MKKNLVFSLFVIVLAIVIFVLWIAPAEAAPIAPRGTPIAGQYSVQVYPAVVPLRWKGMRVSVAVLNKDGEVIQQCQAIDLPFFTKEGKQTVGMMEVDAVIPGKTHPVRVIHILVVEVRNLYGLSFTPPPPTRRVEAPDLSLTFSSRNQIRVREGNVDKVFNGGRLVFPEGQLSEFWVDGVLHVVDLR